MNTESNENNTMNTSYRQKKKKPSTLKSCMAVFGCFGLVLFSIFLGGLLFVSVLINGVSASVSSINAITNLHEKVLESGNSSKKIAVIDVKGVITSSGGNRSMSQNIISQIKLAAEDKNVAAVILNIDSPGGEVVATDEIYNEIQKLRRSGKKVITCMHSMAASGGYYLAAGTDYIVANRLTLTGSVGVIISTVNLKGLFDKYGVKPVVYKSGDLKDTLSMGQDLENMDPILKKKQSNMIQKIVDDSFHEFALIVATGRGMNLDEVKNSIIGEAGVFTGAQAKELKLVDELGYFNDAVNVAKKLAGLTNPQVIYYQKKLSALEQMLSMNSSSVENFKNILPGSMLKAGTLYYILPSAVIQ